ncbi:hypothetical protein Scep_011641 [Stephania cephalantha]|uniref:Uncharacterized protein n=1 Tax=Stephania cephalantha TaxID=152367 RepID=A0AAP0P618_9MAGN
MDHQLSNHTAKMKEMPTIRHHPHHHSFVITQANRTHRISTAQIPRSRKHELGIGFDDRPSHLLRVILRYEVNAREEDVIRTGDGRTRQSGGPGAGATDVGGEEDDGEEDEEAEGDGDGVVKAAEEPDGGVGGGGDGVRREEGDGSA